MTPPAGPLILVPTALELQSLRQWLPGEWRLAECGFGPVAAGIETAMLLANADPPVEHVVLVGVGGTLDESLLAPGSAASFRQVCLDGVGAGAGADGSAGDRLSPCDLNIPQARLADGTPVFDTLPLVALPTGLTREGVLTVTSASGTRAEANQRLRRHSHCCCEEMEGFAVALAAARAQVRCSIARGISNVAGDRDHRHWQIDKAMQSIAHLLQDCKKKGSGWSGYFFP